MSTQVVSATPRPSKTRWGRLLADCGFDWDVAVKDRDGERRYQKLVEALGAYVNEQGDALLPRSFRVPAREPHVRRRRNLLARRSPFRLISAAFACENYQRQCQRALCQC